MIFHYFIFGMLYLFVGLFELVLLIVFVRAITTGKIVLNGKLCELRKRPILFLLGLVINFLLLVMATRGVFGLVAGSV